MSSLRTSLTRALGIDVPIVRASIGSATFPELAAAVSDVRPAGTVVDRLAADACTAIDRLPR